MYARLAYITHTENPFETDTSGVCRGVSGEGQKRPVHITTDGAITIWAFTMSLHALPTVTYLSTNITLTRIMCE